MDGSIHLSASVSKTSSSDVGARAPGSHAEDDGEEDDDGDDDEDEDDEDDEDDDDADDGAEGSMFEGTKNNNESISHNNYATSSIIK